MTNFKKIILLATCLALPASYAGAVDKAPAKHEMTKEEFMKKHPKDEARFDAMDTNKDGKLSADEKKAAKAKNKAAKKKK